MGGEVAGAARALDLLGRHVEPVDDGDDAFHASLASALADVARARACAVLGRAAGGLHRLAVSAPVESERLRAVVDADGRPDRAEAADVLVVPWRTGDFDFGAIAAFDPAQGAFSEDDRVALAIAANAAALLWRQRRALQRQVTDQTAEAERAIELEEMKRRILNLAAHELRGPITVIRGYLEMLADGSLDDSGLRRVLPILNGKAAQMDGLVTQMLEVARLDEGRLELRQEILDLGTVCRAAVDVAGLIAPAGISVFLERPPKAIPVLADRDRLATVITNLLDNAIKYSPEGGAVHCRAGVAVGRAYVEVRDNGLGIAAEDLPTLFERFGRIVTPENSHIPGTGLGLYLSRDLARMHGGDITVTSELGRGSTFTLWLPAAQDARPPAT